MPRKSFIAWREAAEACRKTFARTNNIAGEYGEHLARQVFGGELLGNSHKSADLIAEDGTRYQVKTRINNSQLGGIRSWEFDYLIGMLLDDTGGVTLAVKIHVDVCREIAGYRAHDNKSVINLNGALLKVAGVENITELFADSMR